MTSIFLIYICVALLLAVKRPTYFAIYYLLSCSKFLGFFDTEIFFVFGGLGLGLPILNVVALMAALINIRSQKISKRMFLFALFMTSFMFYGIVAPLLSQSQGLMQSVIASKHYWSVFLFIYLAVNRNRIDVKLLLSSIKFLGATISLSYVFYDLTGLSAPFYFSFGVFRAFYPTFISFALFIIFHEWLCGARKTPGFMLWACFLLAGIKISGYDSLFYSTLLCLSIAYLYIKLGRWQPKDILVILTISLFCVVTILINMNLLGSVGGRLERIVSGKDVALASRATYNEFRWQAIGDSPFGGYGFIHHSSSVVNKYQTIDNSRFTENFSVIDSGYVDLLITFGYVGTSIYLIVLAGIILNYGVRYRRRNVLKAVISFFLLQYFFVNYTWSVWSFSHGLIPAFLAFFILMRAENNGRIDRAS